MVADEVVCQSRHVPSEHAMGKSRDFCTMHTVYTLRSSLDFHASLILLIVMSAHN